jgi:hypothetical protein
LASQGVKDIKPEIEKMLPTAKAPSDTAALEVALALLGDPAYLKGEHFKLMSYSIGYGGLKAIEQFDGVHGLDILIQHATNHPWAYVRDEAVTLAKKLTKQNWKDGYDGAKQAKKWWTTHGQTFVEQRRKEKR